MQTLYTNDRQGFSLWLKNYRRLEFELTRFKVNAMDLLLYPETYNELLHLKSQGITLRLYMNEEQFEYFFEILFPGLTPPRDERLYKLDEEIYNLWRKIMFHKHASPVKTVDPVLLGGNLRALRIRRNMNARTVAKLANIAEKSLYNYEEGCRHMRIDDFYRLCQILKTDSESLLKAAERQ